MFKRLRNAIKGKLTYGGISALAVGLVSELLGVDLAPAEVDAVMTAVATLAAIYGRWRATRG